MNICNIEIKLDDTYRVNSTDHRHYDLVYELKAYNAALDYSVIWVRINLKSKVIDIALVGEYCCSVDGCWIFDGNLLTILQNHTIIQLNIYDFSLIRQKQLDSSGYNFGIYRIKDGFIIYGEIEIMMLDQNFNKKWEFMGRDIFVHTSKNAFELGEDRIKLYDFLGNFYEIDFDGKLLNKE